MPAAEQSLAADGAIACFSSSFFPLSLDADRAPQLKAKRYASIETSREGETWTHKLIRPLLNT
jgi:hypothetical protein